MSDQTIGLPKQAICAERASTDFSPTPTLSKDLSDKDLMERLIEGDPNALPLLFRRYHRLVLNIATKTIHDLGEAEDLVQEVFFEIYRAARSFNPEKGSLKGWIFQCAYRRSLDRWRHLNSKGFYDTGNIAEIQPNMLEAAPNSFHFYGMTIEECSRLLQQGMATLNEKQGKTLELAFFRGLSLAEIADQIGESLCNVRNLYYRGLDKLRIFVQTDSRARAVAEPRLEDAHAKARIL